MGIKPWRLVELEQGAWVLARAVLRQPVVFAESTSVLYMMNQVIKSSQRREL